MARASVGSVMAAACSFRKVLETYRGEERGREATNMQLVIARELRTLAPESAG